MMKKIVTFTLCWLVSAYSFANPVWIDVRSAAEYKIEHIEGDIRISHQDIVPEVMARIADKQQQINLYCRSGRRAGIAKLALQKVGYVNVSNIGSLQNAQKLRAAGSNRSE